MQVGCGVRSSRAQASGFIIFFLMLAISAILWSLLDPAAMQIFAMTANQTSDAQAENVIAQRQQIWTNILFFVVILSGLFLIARAVLQSR